MKNVEIIFFNFNVEPVFVCKRNWAIILQEKYFGINSQERGEAWSEDLKFN